MAYDEQLALDTEGKRETARLELVKRNAELEADLRAVKHSYAEYIRTHCVCRLDDDGNIASMCDEHKHLIEPQK